MPRPGVYIHIPFCASKCAYCSFYSIPDISRAGDYLSALLREMELRAGGWQGVEFGSVYIGGGTPSILPPGSVPRLLDALRSSFHIATDCEISCEANPDSFTADHANAWAGAGVNRISIGLQSADESMLRVLGRIHGPGQFLCAVENARDAGIDNINGDMIFGVPGQSIAMLDETMQLLHRAEVRHISCYGLQLEHGTPLYRRVNDGSLTLPDEDDTGNMYEHIKAALPALGYMRYEISNFAMTGHECRHNLNYWANGEYLALGAAASGAARITDNAAFSTGRIAGCAVPTYDTRLGNGVHMHRYNNPSDIDEYIANTMSGRLTALQPIPRDEEMFESIMLATRTAHGLQLDDFAQRYGVDFLRRYEKAANRCLVAGLAVILDGCFRLTERGLDVQNSVLLPFMDY